MPAHQKRSLQYLQRLSTVRVSGGFALYDAKHTTANTLLTSGRDIDGADGKLCSSVEKTLWHKKSMGTNATYLIGMCPIKMKKKKKKINRPASAQGLKSPGHVKRTTVPGL